MNGGFPPNNGSLKYIQPMNILLEVRTRNRPHEGAVKVVLCGPTPHQTPHAFLGPDGC